MKLKLTHAIALCALTLLTSQPVWAAAWKGPQAGFQIDGTIRPESCAVSLGNSADYGRIAADAILDDENGTDLKTASSVPLKIDCGGNETILGVSLADNISNSRVDGLKVYDPIDGTAYPSREGMFGLGMSNDKKIGAYMVTLSDATVNTAATRLGLVDANDTYAHRPHDIKEVQDLWANQFSKDHTLVTWVDDDQFRNVLSGTLFMGKLSVRATVNKASELDLSNDVNLAGSATLTVYFL